ncbi:hypothetical protein QR680_001755 [Steinernema hermaphroditum]|uniref:ENTH domain-containing protein n=1 Tax=Steinernema hermaphroditum TaxID=289476 RepID=A0AA39H1S8_9BILA|nr:hypothetical protein QR680_001755 [Steinernema hermaphroditum]
MSDLLSGIASLTKSVTESFNTYEIRKIGDKVQGYVMNYTEAENKVREATNEDPWGPTGPQMQEIAHMTFQFDAFPEIMNMLWKRMLQDNRSAWRRVYKSLILLNHLLKNGSERVVQNSRDHLYEMRSLESYKHIDEKGKDQGINIRHRAKLVIELIQDDEQLRAERRKAKTEGKEKYQGYSKEEMRMGKGGNYSSSSMGDINDWNGKSMRSSKQSDSYRDEPSREVNSFNFPDDERQRSDSPELGIRETSKSPVPEEDDEFGDFTEARSTPRSVPSKSDGVVPPAITAPSSRGITSPIRHQPTVSGAVDNDIFGELTSASASQNQNELDLFGPSVVTAPIGNVPRPPTPDFAAHAPKPSQSDTLVDLFGDAPITAPVNMPKAQSPTDPFGDFAASAIPSSKPEPSVGGIADLDLFASIPPPANGAAANQPSTHGSDPFGNFTQPQAPSSNFDLFSSVSVTAPSASLMTPTSPMVAQMQSMSPSPSASSSNTPRSNASASKTLWDDMKGQVNIDLDNLSFKSGNMKPSLSMNQMQKTKNQGPLF